MMKNISAKIQIIVFALLILVPAVLFVALPDRDFSDKENRVLKSLPTLNAETLTSGKFTSEFETYTADQFPFRDGWVAAKAWSERLSGKTENNDVYFCSDGVLIGHFDAPSQKQISSNIYAVNTFAENTGANVYFSLIPGAVSVWKDKLPANAPAADQQRIIDEIYSQVKCTTVDNSAVLRAHSDEYIYYHTDHHWTSLGAYYGYTALSQALGNTPQPLSAFQPVNVTEDFYGTLYSSSGVRWLPSEPIQRFVSDEGIKVTQLSGEKSQEGVMYDTSKLEVKDKYSYFFGGNTALMRIDTKVPGNSSLLVIRDSYSDCELPFLTADYSTIYVMDLRYYKENVQNFIAENKIDDVVINYSVTNFTSDINILLLSL